MPRCNHSKIRRQRHFLGYIVKVTVILNDGTTHDVVHTPLTFAWDALPRWSSTRLQILIQSIIQNWKRQTAKEYGPYPVDNFKVTWTVYENRNWRDWQTGLFRKPDDTGK